MLKKIIFSLIAALFLFSLIFWQPIAGLGLKLYLKNLSYSALDGKFSSDQIFFEKGQWSVKQGKLTLYDNRNKSSTEQKIFFELHANFAKILRGFLVASLDDPLLQKNCVKLSLAEMEDRPLAVDFNFDEVECASLL